MTFRVKDGLSVNGTVFVDTSTNVRAVSAVITGTSGASSAVTGALQVAGGVGIGGGLFVAGILTATSFVGAFAGAISGVATTATNLQNGSTGQIPYQSGNGITSFAGPGTAGQLLMSAGASAPTYTNTSSIYVGRASLADSATVASSVANSLTAGTGLSTSNGTFNGSAAVTFSVNTATYMASAATANNIPAGTSGQLVYQSAAGATSFAGPGTAGQLLVSSGSSAPTYTNTSSIYVGNAAVANILNPGNTSTQYVGFANKGNNIIGGTAGQLVYQSGADTTVFAGPGTAGQLLMSAGTSAPTYTNTSSIYVNDSVVSTNIRAGTAGQLVYQTGAGATSFAGPGTAGQLLMSAGTSAPTYTSTSSIYVNSAVNAEEIRGGTAGQLVYQSAANVTDFAGPGTAGQILVSGGAAVPVYTSTGSIYVGNAAVANILNSGNTSTQYVGFANKGNNIIGGTAGQLVYQSAADTTTFTGPGTAGQLLMSAGTSAPTYTNTSSIYVNSAVSSEKLKAGSQGAIVYQSAVDTTAFLALSGTAKSLLTAGATAPAYITQVQAQSGTGSTTQATGQSLVVTGGGLGVTGDSYFANSVAVANGLTIGGVVTFNNNVVFNGTATTIASTNTYYTDNLINIHTPPGGVLNPWFVDDLKDIGFVFHYYKNSTDTNAALVLANDTKYLEWYSAGAEGTTGTIWQGTYGTFKTGSVLVDDTTGATSAVTGALQVKGGVGVGGGVYVTGNVTATTFIGALTGTATSSNNLTGGTAGQLVYQTGAGATSFAGPGTSGQILVSGGAAVPVYTNTSSIYVNDSVVSTNIRAGTAGQLVYQTGAGATSFAGPGTSGQLLMSAGTSAPTYTNTSSIYVNSAVNAQTLYGGTTGQLVYQSAAGTTAFAGPGTAGQILVSGGAAVPVYTNTASIYVGNAAVANILNPGNTSTQYVGFANKSNNIIAGTAGQLVYQSGADTTAFAGPGTAGQLLMSAGTSAPTYTNTSSIYVNDAVVATNVRAGTAGQLVYQTGAGATGFAGPGTAGQILVSGGAAVPVYTNTASIYVGRAAVADSVSNASSSSNLGGGTAGQVPYQTGAGATSFYGPGTAGQILVSAGTSAPTYTNTASIYVGNAAVANILNAANTGTQYVGFANKGNNIIAGTAGQLVYQSAADTTGFVGPGTAGQILVSGGAAVPVYTNTASIYVGNAAVANILNAGNTSTQLVGFADQAGKLLAANTGTQYVGFANKSNNIIGGLTGQLHYQSGVDTTAFVGPGTAGQLLVSNGSAAPVYTNTSSIYVNSAVNAEELRGGTAGQLVYQSAANVTDFAGPGTAGQILVSAGAAVPVYTNTASIYVGNAAVANILNAANTSTQYVGFANKGNNIIGGTAGQLHYQSGVDTTAFVGPGTAGQLLMSAGTSAPTYTNTASIYVNRAVTADNLVGGSSISGNLTITGNLVVQGVTTTVDSTVTNIADPIITIGGGAAGAAPTADDGKDRGIAFQWYDSSPAMAKNGFFGFDRSSKYFTFLTSATITGEVTAAAGGTTRGALDANLAGGTAGQLHYQSAADTTAFVGPGTAGQILVSAGTSAPTYTNTSSIYVNRAVTSDSAIGSAGSVANALTISTGLTGTAGTYNGSAAVTVTLNTATLMATALNIANGTSGQLHYQSGANTTAFVGAGTAGQLLMSNGTNAPAYQSTLTVVGGTVNITSVTSSTTTATGALQVQGGVGIGGSLYAGNIYSNGSQVLPTSIQQFTATAGQTTFTISGGYTVGQVLVHANGVLLGTGDYTASNGSTIVLNDARAVNDIIRIVVSQGYVVSTQQAYSFNEYTATGGQTTFASTYNTATVQVYVNGTLQSTTAYTASNGTSIVFGSGRTAGEKVGVVSFNSVSITNAISSSGGTINGTLNVTGTLQQNGVDVRAISAAMAVALGT